MLLNSNVLNASVTLDTIGSPLRLKDVLSKIGTFVSL